MPLTTSQQRKEAAAKADRWEILLKWQSSFRSLYLLTDTYTVQHRKNKVAKLGRNLVCCPLLRVSEAEWNPARKSIVKTWGFPSQFIQINQGVKGHSRHTTRASPGVPITRAGLEPGTSRFSTRRISHYATRGGVIQWRSQENTMSQKKAAVYKGKIGILWQFHWQSSVGTL